MLDLQSVIKRAEDRFASEVESAAKSKGADRARISRRRNETYFTRLTRACLPLSQNYELTDPCYSLCVSMPELLFSKMYFLAWGHSRKQKDGENDGTPANLLRDYRDMFNEFTEAIRFQVLLDKMRDGSIKFSLVCHGLSPTSDTILLLADLGRSLRISYSLGIAETHIMLADVSWIKYNRSINQLMSKKEFLNALRICMDKRKRLYKSMGLRYHVFGISDFGDESENINKTDLEKVTKEFRDLAKVLWGPRSLEPHDPRMKKAIGTAFHSIKRGDSEMLPPDILTLISFPKVASALERSLESELKILRTISELFSTFDEEIFIYYFAQYFAQRTYRDYVKIAPHSEIKFDLPFTTHSKHFDFLAEQKSRKELDRGDSADSDLSIASEDNNNFQIYCPQYKLGDYELLPYTSTSGDVLRRDVPLPEFLSSTILLDDSYDNKLDKIIGVITQTPVASRNRLVADLCSFIHVLCDKAPSVKQAAELKILLARLDERIAEQVFSQEDTPDKYPAIYAEWLKAIDHENSILPFHIIPYLWEEDDWDMKQITLCAQMIYELLVVVNDICD